MRPYLRYVTATLFALPFGLALATTDARADDAGTTNPCGNFDFSAGISCKIEVSGGCSAQCTPLQFEAACKGGCSVTADTVCVNNCGTQCVAMCDPTHLDCFAGCHGECDQPTTTACQQKHPGEDCVTQAKAQCDTHCQSTCQIPPTNCQEHCNKCCTGSCDTQINFDCDFSCFAQVKGGCDVQCTKPEGGIFCNGQFVNASDVQACIAYLATKGLNVDVSARGTATCDLTGCHGTGTSSVGGCAASPGTTTGLGVWGFGALVAVGAAVARSRRRGARQRRS